MTSHLLLALLLAAVSHVTDVSAYESEAHRRRQERMVSRARREVISEYSPPGQTVVDTTYRNLELEAENKAEFDRKMKMYQTSKILGELLEDYDSRLRPSFGGDPVQVDVTIHVDSLGPISETDMSFRVDFAFRQYWQDSRLNFAEKSSESITLSHEFLHKIWLPDTYFPESLSANKHSVMVPNILLRLSPDGNILYSCRVTVVSKCPMDLEYFPLDTQKCSLMIEAYGYTVNDLTLNWQMKNGSDGTIQEPVQVAQAIELSQFKYEPKSIKVENFTLSFSTGNFSDLMVTFEFQRTLLYFVLQSYVPATLIVTLSWVSFWVDPRSIPARASLAITTVLTMITLMGTVNSQLPKVSNVKALDVYFGMCFFYVFGALIEFSVVCYMDKGRQKQSARQKEQAKQEKEKQAAELNRLAVLREVDGLATSVNTSSSSAKPPVINNNHNSLHRSSSPHMPLMGSFDTPLGHWSKPRQQQSGGPPLGTQLQRSDSIYRSRLTMNQAENKLSCSKFDVLTIDNYSRIIFPSTFMILNLVYWGAYTNIMKSVGGGSDSE